MAGEFGDFFFSGKSDPPQFFGDSRRDQILFNDPLLGTRRISGGERANLQQSNFEAAIRQRRLKKERGTFRGQRREDLAEGRKFGERFFSEGQLGRLDAGRTGNIQDVIARRRAQLGGFSSAENQGLREQALRGLTQQFQTSQRAGRGAAARSGLRGGAALAAETQAQEQAGLQRSQLEQDLLVRNIDAKRQALGGFEQSVRSAEAEEQQRQQFNIAQRQREVAGQISSELGFAQLGAGERSQILQSAAADSLAAATERSGGGGKKHFCTQFHSRGLISTRTLIKMMNLCVIGIFEYGKAFNWYFRNADKLAVVANSKNFKWHEYADEAIYNTIKIYKIKSHKEALRNYLKFCSKLYDMYGMHDSSIDPFEMAFLDTNILSNAIGTLKLAFVPKVWKLTFKTLKLRLRAYFKHSRGRKKAWHMAQ